MPYEVQFLSDGATVLYYECDTVIDVLIQLLAGWVAQEIDLPGTFAFLAVHGRDLGVTDADANKATTNDMLREAASEAVLEVCVDNEETTREYLALIGGVVRIVEVVDAVDVESADVE